MREYWPGRDWFVPASPWLVGCWSGYGPGCVPGCVPGYGPGYGRWMIGPGVMGGYGWRVMVPDYGYDEPYDAGDPDNGYDEDHEEEHGDEHENGDDDTN